MNAKFVWYWDEKYTAWECLVNGKTRFTITMTEQGEFFIDGQRDDFIHGRKTLSLLSAKKLCEEALKEGAK